VNIVLIGLNHRSAKLEIRESVAVPADDKGALGARFLDCGAAREAVVLSTCNRTEMFLCTENPAGAVAAAEEIFAGRCDPAERQHVLSSLYERRDSAAVRHLFEVVTSLDSLVVGEPHIIGQVREDFETARQAGTVGKVSGRLLMRALELGKAVRKETTIGESPVSVSSIALDMAARVFGTLEGRTVVVLGAGEMGRQTAILAGHRGAEKIIVSSRTLDRSRQLADCVKGRVTAWDRREQAMSEADVIVTSTAAPEPIIDREVMGRVMQTRRNRPVFIVDIAVPRDVDPGVDSLYNIYRYDLDDLTGIAQENARRRQDAVPAVQEMIEVARRDFETWRKELTVVPTIMSIRDHIEAIRESEVDGHLRRMHSIDERDRNQVEALSHAIVNKILHQPTMRLKEAATHGTELRHASSLRYLFDLNFVKNNTDGNTENEDD
jgi:glutamyl-tRNA reductase